MKNLIAWLLVLTCAFGLVGCSQAEQEETVAMATDNVEITTAIETEPTSSHELDCKSLEGVCADSFIDPSKVTVLGGEWAYSSDPSKFVALATVRYTNKDDEYETAEFAMVGTFRGTIELLHILNDHSQYTRESVLQEFGAMDNQRFPLE